MIDFIGKKPGLVLDSPKMVAAFVEERLARKVGFLENGGFQAIGVSRKGKLIGGFVFHNMAEDRSDVELSVAGIGAFFTEEVLEFLWYNAFDILGCDHVTCRTREDNTRAMALLEKSGFILEGIQRKTYKGKDTLFYGLIKEDIYGRQQTIHSQSLGNCYGK